MRAAAAIGALLGIASRVEETTPGLAAGVSTNATWLAVAFLAGAVARGPGHRRAASCGALALTVANAAYYAWIAATEPGVGLASVAGPPAPWFVLGVLGGALLGAAGAVWARSEGAARVAAIVPLAGVWIVDGVERAGSPAGLVAVAVGVAVPIASARRGRERAAASLVSASAVALALTGRLAPLMP